MKHLFSILICVFYLAQAHAQNTTTAYYYAESLEQSLSSNKSQNPVVLKVVTSDKVKHAYIYDPKTTQLQATLRAKKVVLKTKTYWIADSNFVYMQYDSSKIVFDKNKNEVLFLDKKGKATTAYTIPTLGANQPLLQTKFYENGKPKSQTTLRKAGTMLNIFYPNLNSNIKDALTFENFRDWQHNNTTHFYPNGKTYYTETHYIIEKEEDMERWGFGGRSRDSTAIKIFDSTGVALNTADFWNAKAQEKRGKWLYFDDNGRISSRTDFYKNGNQYALEQEFDTENDSLIGIRIEYPRESMQGIVYKIASTDNIFRKKEAYDRCFRDFSNDTEYLTTPLFEIDRTENGTLSEVKLKAQKYEWTPKTCPPKPTPIVEGWDKTLLFSHEVRVYFADSAGRKTSLAALGNFKNGMPDGVFAAFDAAGDTLASAVYRNGNLGYNKYFAAYMRHYIGIEYTVDSIKQAQKGINERSITRNAQQHNFYKKDKRNIWQRDTILGAIQKRRYEDGTSSYSAQVFCMVKERFSPDSNSLIRLKYWDLDDKNAKISTILYYKNTKIVDSIATIWAEDSLISAQWNTFTHTYIEMSGRKNSPKSLYNIYTMPSDSVFAHYYVSDLAMQNYESSKVHQYYMPPSYRALYKNKYFPTAKFKINDKHYNNDYRDMTDNNMYEIQPFYIDFEYPKINPLHTTTETDSLDKMELYFRNGKNKERIKKERAKGYGSDAAARNGVYLEKNFNNEMMQTNYSNGKREGEMMLLDIINKNTSVYFYKKDTCFTKKVYDKTGKLLSEAVFEPNKNNKITKITYGKYGIEMESIDSSAAGITLYDLYERNDAVSQTIKGFLYDTLGKIALTYQLKAQKEGGFAVQSWYASGKPQVVFGKVEHARYSVIETLNDMQTDTEINWENILLALNDFLILHENGTLKSQGSPNLHCEYEENGQIAQEKIELIPFTTSHVFKYPQAVSKETCIWENLPIQAGKMEENRRIGTWNGYTRTAAKKRVYTLNYNKMGAIDGYVAIYDTSGFPIAEYIYKNGVQDEYKLYQNNKLIEQGKDKASDKIRYQKMNVQGQIYESVTYKNDEKITTKYYPNSNILQSIARLNTVKNTGSDSTFDAQGRLLEASVSNKFGEKTTRKGDVFAKQKTYMDTPIYGSQAEYETHKAALLLEPQADKPDNTPKLAVEGYNTAITDRKTALKMLKQTTALRILTPLSQKDWIDALPENYQKDDNKHLFIKTKDFVIADRYGHRLQFVPSPFEDSLYWNIVLQKPTETLYNPIVLKNVYSGSEEWDIRTEKKKQLYKSWAKDLIMQVELNPSTWVYTTLRLPARILHPQNTADDALLELSAHGLTFNQGSPHQYVPEWDYYDLPKTKSKAEIYDFYKNKAIDTLSYLHADFKLNNTQAFEMANTGIKITPLALTLIANTPLNGMNLLYDMPNDAYYEPVYYPHHQTKNSKGHLICDAFLQQKGIRLFVKFALLEIDALPNISVTAVNTLFDDSEINGAFSVTGDAETHQKFAAYCLSKNIKTIAEKQAKEYYETDAEYKAKYRVLYHFRIVP